MTLKAHFDGKVIVPDERVELRPNQQLIIHIERVGEPDDDLEASTLQWLAANAVDDDQLPTDLAEQHDHYLYGSPKTKW